MDIKQIEPLRREIYKMIKEHRLRDAFVLLRRLVSAAGVWEMEASVDELEESYRLMRQYLLSGYEDSERPAIFRTLLGSLYLLTDRAADRLLLQLSTRYYYDIKRTAIHTQAASLSAKRDELETLLRNRSFHALLSRQEIESAELARLDGAIDEAMATLFKQIWTLSSPLSPEDEEVLGSLVDQERFPSIYGALLPSALLLALLHQFDPHLMELLLELCYHSNLEISQRAIVGSTLLGYLYGERLALYPSINLRLQALQRDEKIAPQFFTVYLQLIRSRETEKISQRLTQEILPEMMKQMNQMGENRKVDSDLEENEGNPQWEELFEKTGLSEKLQEITELQLEGADVFLSTFSHLKQDPFFRELAHWFLPFQATYSVITPLFPGWQGESDFKSLLAASSFLCNSDKYSFALTLKGLPATQREAMLGQFNMEGMQQAQLETQERMLKPGEGKAEVISNQYIQDLYRFFKLHPRRVEFRNPFATPLNLDRIEEFSGFFESNDQRLLIAELYFKKGYYEEAFSLYEVLSLSDPTNTSFLQKCGYALQQLKRYNSALDPYLRAESLLPDNVWTLKQIAFCYRKTGQLRESLLYYQKADRLQPDLPALLLAQANLHLNLHQYETALSLYFKISYLIPEQETALRGIAWSSFLLGKISQAEKYYERVLSMKSTTQDWLNAGHVAFADKSFKKAVMRYKTALQKESYQLERFLSQFRADLPYLKAAGVGETEIAILLDELLYGSDEQKQS